MDSKAAYRRVYDSRHLQADCQEPGSAPETYDRQSSMGCLYVFMICDTRCYFNVRSKADISQPNLSGKEKKLRSKNG